MALKKYTLKKKRDGQGWEKVGTMLANDWSEAKHLFTDNIRVSLADDDQVIHLDDDSIDGELNERIKAEYKGPGYYALDGGSYWNLPLLDIEVRDTYNEDVYTWTIKNVN